ncbi:MAG: hypothetical protein UW63_C0074G0003 [Candidatus Uhrbacteria bacterium GW2011_GWF2_44_350]|uniref:Uncharacterized protein n=1 Tax=Candidatus Uhrbacteria bacterium GW2011_GWF2_44_350 TaxID=1619000 RepID=A0A0G1JB31_9BACT|nr:MAG: hypothetical protein UW63_C0074G0003 [Candidatus Uhrbacteria bacterium GW2011_GWF2_44_350]HBR81111.1 hypothetical protein [Candidatus Uhrbacteria bacterium]HCU31114.1 hypothetical protein [Candidatus Uhrbacteria bacterium]
MVLFIYVSCLISVAHAGLGEVLSSETFQGILFYTLWIGILGYYVFQWFRPNSRRSLFIIPPERRKEFDAAAEEVGMPLETFMCFAIENYMERRRLEISGRGRFPASPSSAKFEKKSGFIFSLSEEYFRLMTQLVFRLPVKGPRDVVREALRRLNASLEEVDHSNIAFLSPAINQYRNFGSKRKRCFIDFVLSESESLEKYRKILGLRTQDEVIVEALYRLDEETREELVRQD